jgi:MerR family transcriptional regulator/heat shock protein HspR
MMALKPIALDCHRTATQTTIGGGKGMKGTRTSDNEPRYIISIAARLVGVQTHTLRYYERIGIIEPSRSSGNIRLYSERDIDILRRVKTLMDDLGVNLAGVEVIMRMSERMLEMQREFAHVQAELEKLREGSE